MILLISTNKNPLHELEFVKPIENLLKQNNSDYNVIHYSKLTSKSINQADKIIICGTSLKDNVFLRDIKKFNWVKKYNKPVLGICAGMQIISLVYNAKLKSKKEIGFYKESFNKEFLSLNGEQEVYHLHNNYTTLPKEFIQFNRGKIPQAIKHKERKVYGVLFHPEVRNKKIIFIFVKDNYTF